MIQQIDIKLLENGQGLDLPSYATEGSAGMDLKAAVENPVEIKPGERSLIPTGISIAIPKGYNGEIRPRSGLALKYGITVLNTPGTVDSDYRGELKVLLINHGSENFIVERGMRIAQLVLQQYATVEWRQVDDLSNTERSGRGYGSTGIR